MKLRIFIPVLAIAISSFLQVGCKKEDHAGMAPINDKANLTIQTVTGPVNKDCGGFLWEVIFNLKNPSKKGGWIVQQITVDKDILTCPGAQYEKKKFTYWEAWRVAAGANGDSLRLAGDFSFDDRYSGPGYPNTKGVVSYTGEVRFFEDLALPGDFKPKNPDTYAGDLPATTTKPAFWGGDMAPHTLISTWNCCIDPKTKSLTTTPVTENKMAQIPNADTSSLDYVGKLINRLADWTTGYYTSAVQNLLNTARTIKNEVPPAMLRNSIINYRNVFAHSSDYTEQMSKVYVLLRALYQLPENINRANVQVFGGWDHPSIGSGSNFNLSWPVSVTGSGTQTSINVADYRGFTGRNYNAVGEFDYFNANFPKRAL